MTVCGHCGAENAPQRRFCRECGDALPASCTGCGYANEPDDRFCGGCGSPLSPAPSRAGSSPERRHLSLMFCDLVGSTALAASLDPEVLREVYRTYQAVAGETIDKLGGYVARYLGDGIMAYFGYPTAHGNDAERAVRAALTIVERIESLNREPTRPGGVHFAVRVAIASGLAVVGDLIVAGSAAEEKAVVGETPNRAARLQRLAVPNGVVVDLQTCRLTQGLFAFQPLGEHRLEGFAQPIGVWLATASHEDASRFEARRAGSRHRLVGRQRELAMLRELWQAAAVGRGRALLIQAEAGLGKSRLAEALAEEVAREGGRVLRYQCSPFHDRSPFYPLIKRLETLAGIERGEPGQSRLAKLARAIAADPHDRESLPVMAELLAIPPEAGYVPLSVAGDERLRRMVDALLAFFERRARGRPHLVVLEDIHWMDPSSGQLVERLFERLPELPVLLLATARPELRTDWIGRPVVAYLRLERLSIEASAELAGIAAGGRTLPAALVERIVAKTDGVPLFVEELTKAILDSGALAEGPDGLELSGTLPCIEIPATLQESLLARLSQLSPVKEIAQIASVIGREVGVQILTAVSGLPMQQIERALDRLCDADILQVRGAGPAAIYRFKHALLQDAAYESLLIAARRELHARAAAILERQFPETVEREPEVIARHFAKAGRGEDALRYWAIAGRRALSRSAYIEVLGATNEALESLGSLAPAAERDRFELRLHVLQGAAYRATRGFASAETESAFLKARGLCERVDDRELYLDTLRGLYTCYYIRGEIRRARAEAERAMELVGSSDRGSERMLGHWMLGCIRFWQGEIAQARDDLEVAVALYRPGAEAQRILSAQLDPGLNALAHLAWSQWMLGLAERSAVTAERAIATARALAQPFGIALVLDLTSSIRIGAGEIEAAAASLPELRELTATFELSYFGPGTAAKEGLIAIRHGSVAEGLDKVERAFGDYRAQRAGLGLPWAISQLAAALIPIGHLEKAGSLLADALAIVEAKDERQSQAELLRLQGDLKTAQGDHREAAERYRAALSVARTQGAKALELRAATGLARSLGEQGRPDEARSLLAPLIGWFREGLEAPDLKAARALLLALPVRPA